MVVVHEALLKIDRARGNLYLLSCGQLLSTVPAGQFILRHHWLHIPSITIIYGKRPLNYESNMIGHPIHVRNGLRRVERHFPSLVSLGQILVQIKCLHVLEE